MKIQQLSNDRQEVFKSFVAGRTYSVLMGNGAVFDIWSPCKLSRKDAKAMLLKQANGDYLGEDAIYSEEDIEKIRSKRGHEAPIREDL